MEYGVWSCEGLGYGGVCWSMGCEEICGVECEGLVCSWELQYQVRGTEYECLEFRLNNQP